jgi:hypothetical protein
MYALEKFKPVKHTKIFEKLYDKAIESLSYILNENSSKKNQINNSKNKCLFDKKIFIYTKQDNFIGFCMYELIDGAAFIILDYVDNEFKGGGRKCRELLIYEMKNISEEVKGKIHIKNKKSLNSALKVKKTIQQKFYIEHDDFSDLTEWINFTIRY